jgi:hypothetical protein
MSLYKLSMLFCSILRWSPSRSRRAILGWLFQVVPGITQMGKHVVQSHTTVDPSDDLHHVWRLLNCQPEVLQRGPSALENPDCVFVPHPGPCQAVVEFCVFSDVCCRGFVSGNAVQTQFVSWVRNQVLSWSSRGSRLVKAHVEHIWISEDKPTRIKEECRLLMDHHSLKTHTITTRPRPSSHVRCGGPGCCAQQNCQNPYLIP